MRQSIQHFACGVREEVTDRRERQLRLRFGGTRGQDEVAQLFGLEGRVPPERGLADPRITVDDERAGARAGQERLQQGKFVAPADDVEHLDVVD